ncbi:MAG: RcnB family protein [Erythrobacter sp.]
MINTRFLASGAMSALAMILAGAAVPAAAFTPTPSTIPSPVAGMTPEPSAPLVPVAEMQRQSRGSSSAGRSSAGRSSGGSYSRSSGGSYSRSSGSSSRSSSRSSGSYNSGSSRSSGGSYSAPSASRGSASATRSSGSYNRSGGSSSGGNYASGSSGSRSGATYAAQPGGSRGDSAGNYSTRGSNAGEQRGRRSGMSEYTTNSPARVNMSEARADRSAERAARGNVAAGGSTTPDYANARRMRDRGSVADGGAAGNAGRSLDRTVRTRGGAGGDTANVAAAASADGVRGADGRVGRRGEGQRNWNSAGRGDTDRTWGDNRNTRRGDSTRYAQDGREGRYDRDGRNTRRGDDGRYGRDGRNARRDNGNFARRDNQRGAYRAGFRDGASWDRGWRNNNRFNWIGHRRANRFLFAPGPFIPPFAGHFYRPVGIGFFLDPLFFQPRFFLNDPWAFRLPPPGQRFRWVRYYDDVLLVDIFTGEVVDSIEAFFF